jgi:hypothetical protein
MPGERRKEAENAISITPIEITIVVISVFDSEVALLFLLACSRT